jgi:predicted ATPase
LGRLEQARRQAAAGRCQAVLLCGEPGIGKTRTAAEVAKAAFDEGAIALYGRCDEEIRVPYQPFAEALDWYTGHVDQPVLGRHPGELIRLQPLLGSRLAGLAAPVSSDPRSEEFLLFEATRAWLVALSRQQPVVLVLDDLHWASRPVLLLLRHVLRTAVAEGEGVRLLVLGTYRDTELGRNHALAGVMADVRRLPGVEQLAMAGLSAVEVAALLSQAAGHELDDDGRRLAERLHAETEGNPFFVGEVLRHLAETGMLRRQGAARPGKRGVPDDPARGRLARAGFRRPFHAGPGRSGQLAWAAEHDRRRRHRPRRHHRGRPGIGGRAPDGGAGAAARPPGRRALLRRRRPAARGPVRRGRGHRAWHRRP